MSASPPSPSRTPDSIALAGSEVHGLKRGRDMNPLGPPSDPADEHPSVQTTLKKETPSLTEQELSSVVGHTSTPLAKRGRRLSKTSNDEQTSPPTNNHPKSAEQSHASSVEGSDRGTNKSRMATPEATEVQSVRKKVAGMGVENDQEHVDEQADGTAMDLAQPFQTTTSATRVPEPQNPSLVNPPSVNSTTSTSDALPASWSAYAHSSSPFTINASNADASIFSSPHTIPPDKPSDPVSHLSTTTNTVRTFAAPHSSVHKGSPSAPRSALLGAISGSSSLASASPNFPCGPDFFLKGKRNNWVTGTPSELESSEATQSKKLKLPESTIGDGFAAYSTNKPTSLKPAALAQLNNNQSLQIPSLVAPHLNAVPPPSATSSVCAVNGDEDFRSPPPSTTSTSFAQTKPNPSPLGFSSFSNVSSFGQPLSNGTAAWTSSTTSVFDQADDSTPQGGRGEDGWGSAGKKTHLALAADLSEEDRHAGFEAKDLVTGEENENLIKSVRCKVFTLEKDGSWHERGSGGLRLLRTKARPYRYRLIMRADAVHRVLLNVPVFKGFNFVPSQDRFLSFASTVTGIEVSVSKVTPSGVEDQNAAPSSSQFQQYLCRFSRPEARQDIIESIKQCLSELESRPAVASAAEPEASTVNVV